MEIRIINPRLATKGDHKQKEPFILDTLTPEQPLTRAAEYGERWEHRSQEISEETQLCQEISVDNQYKQEIWERIQESLAVTCSKVIRSNHIV